MSFIYKAVGNGASSICAKCCSTSRFKKNCQYFLFVLMVLRTRKSKVYQLVYKVDIFVLTLPVFFHYKVIVFSSECCQKAKSK